MIRVDLATGSSPPPYTMEIARHLPATVDCRLIQMPSYGAGRIGTAYRLVHHPLKVRQLRRPGSVLHVDSQLLSYVLTFPQRPPTVLTVHDLVPFLPEFDDPSYVSRNRAVDRAFFASLRRGIRGAGTVVTPSDFVRRQLAASNFGRTDVEVVPMGVDTGTFRPRDRESCEAALAKYAIPLNRPLVLYVGSEHPRKNLERLFRAFARIPIADAVLVKVGAPRHPQRGRLVALVTSLGIVERVAFVDHVKDVDLPCLYAAADVLVLPSLHEGFGLPPLEAMACGTPVAVSNVTSLPEVVGDAGLFFDPRDEGEIAEAVHTAMKDNMLRETLRARGLERASLFRWERTVELLARIYERTSEADESASDAR